MASIKRAWAYQMAYVYEHFWGDFKVRIIEKKTPYVSRKKKKTQKDVVVLQGSTVC